MIVPDKFYEIPFITNNIDQEPLVVNAKYDRVDHYKPLGIWMIKIMSDKDGMITAIVDETNARKIAEFALLPIVERPYIFESEHEVYIEAMSEIVDDSWLED